MAEDDLEDFELDKRSSSYWLAVSKIPRFNGSNFECKSKRNQIFDKVNPSKIRKTRDNPSSCKSSTVTMDSHTSSMSSLNTMEMDYKTVDPNSSSTVTGFVASFKSHSRSSTTENTFNTLSTGVANKSCKTSSTSPTCRSVVCESESANELSENSIHIAKTSGLTDVDSPPKVCLDEYGEHYSTTEVSQTCVTQTTRTDSCSSRNIVSSDCITNTKHSNKKQTSLLFFYITSAESKFVTTELSVKRKPQENLGNFQRQCPFYKKVYGTNFAVDAFSYGDIPNCRHYFLTHFHSDHYYGLKRSFSHSIHCSKITATLVVNQLKVSPCFVHSYDLNTTYDIEGVRVTFLDANHCPGAAMVLFQLPSGTNILHTGDFRVHQRMLSMPQLKGLVIHTLHLDTTYCDQKYVFPTQEEVIDFVVDRVKRAIAIKPDTLVLCGSYTIGKEKIFLALAEAIGCKAGVSKQKKQVLDCLCDSSIDVLTTTDVLTTRLHVVPMNKLNVKDLKGYLGQHSRYGSLIAIRPTGWTYGGVSDGKNWQIPQSYGSVTIYNIPYSEHSSVTELEMFVRHFLPKRVIPTVGVGDPKRRECMTNLINTWLKPR